MRGRSARHATRIRPALARLPVSTDWLLRPSPPVINQFRVRAATMQQRKPRDCIPTSLIIHYFLNTFRALASATLRLPEPGEERGTNLAKVFLYPFIPIYTQLSIERKSASASALTHRRAHALPDGCAPKRRPVAECSSVRLTTSRGWTGA